MALFLPLVHNVRALLLVDDVVDDPTEKWTEAPVESDEEDASLRNALAACEESDQEEADDSEPVIPMTLREARSAGQALKIDFNKK